jgi:hypothetical protein
MGMQRPGCGSKPARGSLIGWSSDGRAEFFAPPFFASPVFAPTVLRLHRLSPHHFQHRSQSNGDEGGVEYLLASDLRYLLSKNPLFVSLRSSVNFPFSSPHRFSLA